MTREDILKKHPNATEAQIESTLAHYNDQPVDMETTFADMAKGVARSAGQGLTFGTADELTALARSLFGAGSYDDLIQEERDALDDFREDHPFWAYGTEIASGMLLPGGALKSGLTAARAAKVGAATGAAYGAGTAEGGIQDRALGAGIGATLGAPLGAGGQKLTEMGSRYLRRRLGKRPGREYRQSRDKDVAVGTLQREFRDELETTDPARLAELEAQGIPPSEAFRDQVSGRMTIADLPAMESARSGVSQGFGGARRIAAERLEARAVSEYDDLMGEMETVLRGTERADDMVVRTQKITGRRERPHYEVAGRQELTVDDWMEDVLFDPLVKGVYNARRANVNTFVRNKRPGFTEDDLMPAWDDLVEVAKDGTKSIKFGSIATQHLHQLKQGLDKKAKWASSKVSPNEEAYRTLVTRINNEVGELNPSYKIANRINHLGHQVETAVKKGAAALRNTSDTAVRKEFDALSSALEKKAFRSGMLQELNNRVGDASIGTFLSRSSSKRIRNALKAVFPDEDSYNTFINRAKQERGFRAVEADVGVGGSRTARTAKDVQKWESGGLGKDVTEAVISGTAVSAPWAAMGFVKKYSRLLSGIKDQRIAREAADILFTETPEQAQKAFDTLLNTGKRLSSGDLKLLRMMKGALSGVAAPVAGLTTPGISGLLSPQ